MAVEDAITAPREEKEKAGSPGRRRTKFDVFNAVLSHLSDSVAVSPQLENSLLAHFNRLPLSYAMDFTVERAEDALTHIQLLEEARDPANCPSVSVRVVQAPRAIDSNTTKYELNTNLEGLESNNDEKTVHARLMYEIIFSADDKPKVLNQLTSVLGLLGLDIQEAHAYSTNDGFSLVVFVAVGWLDEETDQLKQALTNKIERVKVPEMKDEKQVLTSSHGHVIIPTDEQSVWEINFNLLRFGNKVASGSYGDLYKGTYCSQEVAIKVIKAEGVNVNVLREFAHEVSIMRKIRHKNVVQFIGACTRPKLCIVTEFMSGGSLYDYLHKENDFLKVPALLRVAIDVSKGMNYLHQNNIIHRDLKTANILMDENKVVKVSDFGVARVKAQSGVMTAETGTYRWMAPEVIAHKLYDHKADVFSFGILLWELLTGKVPYDDMTPVQAAIGVVQKGLRPTIPNETNSKLAELIEKCWQQEPSLRPDFSQILEALNAISKEVGDNSEDRKTKSPRNLFSFMRNRN
ncbi:hypothetical protein LUZ61_014926 [Rhynchospora tenuis]|uniref:non-specific serine/threonine protein kinase n=1 Tax=Rhynchospora tenuis TaxID=198213 RepID=A0AAD5Z2W3_9POAL|nr:hypothetical protein LUZ61_014926 [Rhynchospora tenuis]